MREPHQDPLATGDFFITPEHPCSYLPGQTAQTIFMDPRSPVSPEVYEALSRQGFRRSGSHVYRPHCQTCQACIPARIPVTAFVPKRRQRRVATVNQDLRVTVQAAAFTPEIYALYARYIAGRHQDGDMYPPSVEQFRSFLLSHWCESLFICSWFDGALIAVAVTDRLPNALSAIYTFFEPQLAGRSLGVFSILQQIDLCRRSGLEYLYLGYWIRDSRKMRYKIEYRPLELLINDNWVRIH